MCIHILICMYFLHTPGKGSKIVPLPISHYGSAPPPRRYSGPARERKISEAWQRRGADPEAGFYSFVGQLS